MVFSMMSWFNLAAVLAILAVKAFVFVSALTFSAEAYEASGKLTKTAWCLITGLALAAQLLLWQYGPLNFVSLAFTIAALVYLADVRPALKQVSRGRR